MRAGGLGVIALLFAVDLSGPGEAAAPKGSAAKQGTSVKAAQFDPTVGRLPAGFRGASLLPILDRLAPTGPPEKGEFESTAEFERRIARDRFPFGTWIAAAFTEQDSLDIAYDADREELRLRLAGNEIDATGGRIVVGFFVQQHTQNESSRVGRNAFNASVTIRHYDATSIFVGAWKETVVHRGEAEIEATLKVPRARARNVKEYARALLVFRTTPIPDGISGRTTRVAEASFDSPYEGMRERALVFASQAELWYYLPATGEVLGQWLITEPPPPQSPPPAPAPKE